MKTLTKVDDRLMSVLEDRGNRVLFADDCEGEALYWDMATLTASNDIAHRFMATTCYGTPDDSESLLIELKGALGLESWLYGHADYIAVETDGGKFVVFSRIDLVQYVLESYLDSDDIELTREVPRYGYRLGKFYGTPGTKDLKVFIGLAELRKSVKCFNI